MDPLNPERDKRGNAVRRFMEDASCRVLLSSNVGGEGLDLQRASVVVNYDMPWNPAVVEQRIGRVDRFGQDKETIQVMNFLLPGTVEETIFGRLDERLQMFNETIGDFGRVLGEVVEALSKEFLQDGLTLDQLDERARDEAWRLQNRLSDLSDLISREGEFVAFDEDFADHLRNLDREGKTIRPADLDAVCTGVLKSHFPKSWLRPAFSEDGASELLQGVFDLRIDFDLHHHLRSRLSGEKSGALQRFVSQVPPDTVRRVTFDGETAEREPELLLITARHPLIRALVEISASGDEFHPVSALELSASRSQGLGEGLLVLAEGEVVLGAQERRYLIPVFVPESGSGEAAEARHLIRNLLDEGKTTRPRKVPTPERLREMLDQGHVFADKLVWSTAERILNREEARMRPRVAELKERYSRRIQTNLERTREERGKRDPSEKRMKGLERYGKRLRRELERKIAEVSRTPEPRVESRPVGVAWVEVR